MLEKLFKWLPALVGLAATLVLVGALLAYEPRQLGWDKAIALAMIAAFVFALVAAMRFATGGLLDPTPPSAASDPDEAIRSRLAPLVIRLGTAGILVTAIAVFIMLALRPAEVTTYLGIFSTVVPVFSTWVGAVIAFFFSNESFREAARANNALRGDPTDDEPVTAPHRMIPLDKITGLVLPETPAGQPRNALALADALRLGTIRTSYSNTVTRVIVFDRPRFPLLIIRQKLAAALPDDKTVADYRAADSHAADAVNFRFVPENATVGQARQVLRTYGTVDLFITPTGRPDEPISGWLTDTQLA